MYAPAALSAELIFAQAILKEIGLSFLIHARADSSTARAVATKQGASRKMKHMHTRFLFIQDLVFRKLLTMSSVKTDVNPSDIGTKAQRREGFHKLRSMLRMGTERRRVTTCQWILVWWIGRVGRSKHRVTHRESDTAARREEACLLNLCYVVAQWSRHSLLQ